MPPNPAVAGRHLPPKFCCVSQAGNVLPGPTRAAVSGRCGNRRVLVLLNAAGIATQCSQMHFKVLLGMFIGCMLCARRLVVSLTVWCAVTAALCRAHSMTMAIHNRRLAPSSKLPVAVDVIDAGNGRPELGLPHPRRWEGRLHDREDGGCVTGARSDQNAYQAWGTCRSRFYLNGSSVRLHSTVPLTR